MVGMRSKVRKVTWVGELRGITFPKDSRLSKAEHVLLVVLDDFATCDFAVVVPLDADEDVNERIKKVVDEIPVALRLQAMIKNFAKAGRKKEAKDESRMGESQFGDEEN